MQAYRVIISSIYCANAEQSRKNLLIVKPTTLACICLCVISNQFLVNYKKKIENMTPLNLVTWSTEIVKLNQIV